CARSGDPHDGYYFDYW
nr:immunoglobulin heavy chain junction region [Mus musculus]